MRTSGCNLRCRYCDTGYASWTPEGEELSVAEILRRVDQSRNSPPPLPRTPIQTLSAHADPSPGGVRHVVLTGGEPMLFAELGPLSAKLREQGWHITIETAGTVYLSVACDLMSISPKLSNSTPSEQEPEWARHHGLHRHAPEAIRRLMAEYDYQLKFVVDRLEDCREVEAYLAEFPEIELGRVMLMPQGTDSKALAEKAAWLEPHCAQRGFRFCPRRQIEWFGAERGT